MVVKSVTFNLEKNTIKFVSKLNREDIIGVIGEDDWYYEAQKRIQYEQLHKINDKMYKPNMEIHLFICLIIIMIWCFRFLRYLEFSNNNIFLHIILISL